MKTRAWLWTTVLAIGAVTTAWAGTFGKVVAIGGHASDLALDEGRGVLYIANFTANRIEVMSLADQAIKTSMRVARQPSSISLSRDGKYLVITHYGGDGSADNALTVIDLDSREQQTISLSAPPMGVAFTADNRAFLAKGDGFFWFDPNSKTLTPIRADVYTGGKLPVKAPTGPQGVTMASVGASRDGRFVYGMGLDEGGGGGFIFGYDLSQNWLAQTVFTSSPPMGPLAISVADDGSRFTTGWSLWEGKGGFSSFFHMMSDHLNPDGKLTVGGHIFDSPRNLIYVQVKAVKLSGAESADPPLLQIADGDNLAILEQLRLPENLAGKGVLSSDNQMVYAISDSGVLILPVGSLDKQRRLFASEQDLVFRGSFCDRQATTREFDLTDSSGASTDFIIPSVPGVTVYPNAGMTPARIKVTVDPASFSSKLGTTLLALEIKSKNAVNLVQPVRVLVNMRDPDQRGTFYNVPGKVVDILADPVRDRFYLLRQDRNQVLVYDSNTLKQIATLKTGNVPTQMTITTDGRYLLVAGNATQLLYWYDLDTLRPRNPLYMPGGHYPASVAAGSSAVLVAVRSASSDPHMIDVANLASGTVSKMDRLGIYENKIDEMTRLVASGNGSRILIAEADNTLLVFNGETFTAARQDDVIAKGALAASNYDQFVVGNTLLNASLVPVRQFESGTGETSGFLFVDDAGFRVSTQANDTPGIMQRVNGYTGDGYVPTRTVEAPAVSDPTVYNVFTRPLAVLRDRSRIVMMSTSGFTVLPWNYDDAVAPPLISSVVNAADGTQPVAPGGLISVYGTNLSPVTESSKTTPLPTMLGDSCLTVNSTPVPMIFVSGRQINAQLPFSVDGTTQLVLHTPGGVSDNFNLRISPAAPSIFRASVNDMSVASVVRATNNEMVTGSNPVHRGDILTIYATGLGRTVPEVETGAPAPSDPLAITAIMPTVSLGGMPVEVMYAGLAPGQVGVYQINVRVGIRATLGWGIPLEISQGEASTTLNVRVVQ